jgi:alkanesulfonate monooxygenase
MVATSGIGLLGSRDFVAGRPGPTTRKTVRAAGPLWEGLSVFATTPPSHGESGDTYLQHVLETAQWSEAAGCEGTLIYTDNSLADPWVIAQTIITGTDRLCPLIAVQPAYMHPYTAAKLVASLAFLHGRRVWLNMVAGGFRKDLISLSDHTSHDDRYERAAEYALLMVRLLAGEVTTLTGKYYRVQNVKMSPALPADLQPGLLMSGSSPAGFAAARAIGAVPVKYPMPPGEEEVMGGGSGFGVRIGIIARESEDEAWAIAHERFPEDRKGQIAHRLAMKVSDSSWHHQLSSEAAAATASRLDDQRRNPYWLLPFENYKTFCPYLVGGYDQVTSIVRRYIRLGARTFILDIPRSADEFRHTQLVLRGAASSPV